MRSGWTRVRARCRGSGRIEVVVVNACILCPAVMVEGKNPIAALGIGMSCLD